MVLSTAIPSAIAAMMLVPMFSMMFDQPRMPKKNITGTMFGSIAMKPTFADRNSSDMTTKMTASATVTLFTCPHTTSSVVPFKRMMLPVGSAGMPGCCSAHSRMRPTTSAISVEVSKRVRTSTLACPKSRVMTDSKLSGFCRTIVSTSSSRLGSSQKLFTSAGFTSLPWSSITMSPLARRP